MKTRIKKIRKSRALTAAELAKKIGVTQPTISRYERESRKMTVENAQRISATLGCTIDELFEREDEEGVADRKSVV